ncbi:MAG: HDOD domain-containing protein [Phycisphaerales bacterium]
MPAAAIEVLELSRDPNVDMKMLAKVIQNDPAMTGKILKTVNSSYYRLTVPCPTIQRALAYLGLNLVRSLVLGFSLVETARGVAGAFDYEAFWRRSIYAATTARRLSMTHRRCDPDEAFTGALLEDIGMLAMQARLAEEYAHLVEKVGRDHRELVVAEQERYGFDHVAVGAALAEKWKLPLQLIMCIEGHHGWAQDAPDELGRTVTLATEAVLSMEVEPPKTALDRFRRHAGAWFEMSTDQIDEVIRAMPEDADELARMFNVAIGTPADVDELLGNAEELRNTISVDQQKQIETLRETVTELNQVAATDPLTAIGNRMRFDTEIATWFEQATQFRGVLGLIILDLDHFKSVNDTHGHQVGDAVLVETARRVTDLLRQGDVLCRYGGEEFAVILPGSDAAMVAGVAERLRAAVADAPFDMNVAGETLSLPITLSAGGATLDRDTECVITSPALLIRAADRALYASKHGGRNTVRVFRMKQEGVAREDAPSAPGNEQMGQSGQSEAA